jgi:hypothetical protein
VTFLETKYKVHGSNFIKYLFGSKAAQLCDYKSSDLFQALATALIGNKGGFCKKNSKCYKIFNFKSLQQLMNLQTLFK